jgi:hypothetical protein
MVCDRDITGFSYQWCFFDMKVEQTDISIEDREIPVGNWDVFVFT